jgi:hypothetical protein
VSAADGSVTLAPTTIDPPSMSSGSDTISAHQQRAGLLAANGNVYIGFGGLVGDCFTYHGWVVAASESSGSIVGSFQATAVSNAGAVWATGAPAHDSSGNVYASTGNGQGSPSSGTDYSDAVVKISASMSGATIAPVDYFQPTEWRSDNNADADLGSAAPVLLPNGTQLFIIGKQHNAFLLNTSSLGGGGTHETPAARLDNACAGEVFGQNAIIPATNSVYIACSDGMRQIHLP